MDEKLYAGRSINLGHRFFTEDSGGVLSRYQFDYALGAVMNDFTKGKVTFTVRSKVNGVVGDIVSTTVNGVTIPLDAIAMKLDDIENTASDKSLCTSRITEGLEDGTYDIEYTLTVKDGGGIITLTDEHHVQITVHP